MRTSICTAVVAGILALTLPGSALASENIIKFFERNSEAYVTQAEWAVYLVKALGKDDEVGSGANELDFIALLEKNRVQPLEGWNHSEYLSYGQKAVTMVQALGLEDQLKPDATEWNYIQLLEGLGFHEGMPAELVRQSEALQRNINDPIFQELNEFNIQITRFAPRVNETGPQ